MKQEEKLKIITETFKGKTFKRIEYNEMFDCFEVHFADGKYFSLRMETSLHAEMREIWIAPELRRSEKD